MTIIRRFILNVLAGVFAGVFAGLMDDIRWT
jgi:hypothetical protein